MRPITSVCVSCTITLASLAIHGVLSAQQSASKADTPGAGSTNPAAMSFDTPQQAADMLVNAAEKFDVATLTEIFGPDGNDIVLSGEFSQDRKHAADFAAQARKKEGVSLNAGRTRAFLLV